MFKNLTYVFITLFIATAHADERPGKLAEGVNPGALHVVQLGGEKPDQTLELPLQHTDVQIEVSGFVAQAVVTQRFHNPFRKPIEAVYTFPLPDDAAVNHMQMQVGERIITGTIKRRAEARRVYEHARRQGKRAALLEQERPNVFTQSVANILPGEHITVSIRYVDLLKYEKNAYELVFPMVVAPRYTPGNMPSTPPVLEPGQRSGHDISLSVKLDAGVPIQKLHSPSHRLETEFLSPSRHTIRLYPADNLPNKDFILRYHTAGKTPQMALLAHHDERGGFFTLLIQPQETVSDAQTVARELIFILDTSGSMSGAPIAQSKQAMRRLLEGMRDGDTFNVVRFAGDTGTLWDAPRPYTPANAETAWQYVNGFSGSGGTEMRRGIVKALARPAADGTLRLAFLLSDGLVGNESGILQAIEKERRGARVFTLGVGSSPNRYLLNRAADIGRGEAFYLRHDAPAEETTRVIGKIFQRVDRPALAYLNIDWGGLDVEQLYPARLPDVFAGQPVRIHGRYQQGGSAEIILTGEAGRQAYRQKLAVTLPRDAPQHATMADVWARRKVRELMTRMEREGQTAERVETVTQTGLTFRLMTKWTSFVAVEEDIATADRPPQTVVQPVELAEGMSYEGVFGPQGAPTQSNNPWSQNLSGMGPARQVADEPLTEEEIAVLSQLKAMSWDSLSEKERRLDDVFDVFGGTIHEHRLSVATGNPSKTHLPAVVAMITAQDIEAMGARDLDEVLRAVPGLHVSYNTLGNPIYTLRGIASATNPEVLLLVNGISLNNAQEGSTGTIWTGMPVQHIMRIEIIRGPLSVRYGGLAGVINIITKTADHIDGTEAGGRYGSFDTREGWLLHGAEYKGNKVAVMLQYSETGGHDEIIHTDAQSNYDAAFGTEVSEAPGRYETRNRAYDLYLDLSHGHWRARTGFHQGRDRGAGAGPTEALSADSEFADERFHADLTYANPSLTEHWGGSIQLSYLRRHWQGDLQLYPPGAFGGAYPDGMLGKPSVRESHTRLDIDGAYAGFDHHVLHLGAGYGYEDQYETGDTTNFSGGPGPLIDHSDPPLVFTPETARDRYYLRVEDRWRIDPDWTLSAGLRYDDSADFPPVTSPRFALKWEARMNFTAKLLYGQGLRIPAFNERYIFNNPVQRGNPHLQAEESEQWELAFDWWPIRELGLALHLFRYDITDKIFYPPGDADYRIAQNAADWRGHGLEFEARWKVAPSVGLLLNYAWQDSEDRNSGQTLGNSPAHQIYVRSDWLVGSKWYVDVQLNWAGDWSRPDPGADLDDTLTTDLTLRYKKYRSPWNFALGVRNLFDADVRSPSRGADGDGVIAIPDDYPRAGRSYFGEVRYTF